MKKILFIPGTFSNGGGSEALLTSIVNNLNPNKYEISILENYHYEEKKEPVNAYVHVLPYLVDATNDKERKEKKYRIFNDTDAYIEENIPRGYDLYVSFNYLQAYLLPPWGKNLQWQHGDIYNCLSDPVLLEEHDKQNSMYNKAEKMVVISDYTEQSVIDVFPEQRKKLVKIYNGIDIELIRKKSKEPTNTIIKEKPSMVISGRLESGKDPVRAVDILSLIHLKGIKLHLYYLGKGKLKEDILKKAQEVGLDRYIHVLGYYDNPFPIVKQCNCSLMTSKSEGFQMSLLESLALGVPFVSTDVGSSKLMSNNGRCGKVFCSDEEAANAVIELIEKPNEQIIKECNLSVQRFEMKEYIRKIEALLDEMLE